MKIRDCVFGSEGEKALYKQLVSRWSRLFSVYPSLPFANIVDLSGSELTRNERSFLYISSVDYTLCTKVGKPLLSIEFDGLADGFSRETEYIMKQAAPEDPNREWKLNLKLKVCMQVGYPFFVVSYEEARPIGPKLHLTIVDGLIGNVLAAKATRHLLGELVAKEEEAISRLSYDARRQYLEDLLDQADMAAKLDWNPIFRTASEYEMRVFPAGFEQPYGWRREVMTYPRLPDWSLLNDPNVARRWVEAWERAERVGCKVTVEVPEGRVVRTAWVRNIMGSEWSIDLAQILAKLLAYSRVLEIRGEQ